MEEFQTRKAYTEKRKNQNRGKSATPAEIKEAVVDYLSGEKVSNIAKILYRSPAFIKSILDRVGVPQRPSSLEDRKMPTLLPENCIAEEFEKGEIVWSAAYHAPAEICKEYEDKRSMYMDRYGSRCYSIYVYEKSSEDIYYSGVGGFYAASCAYDLGKLSHIEAMGIDIRKQVA